MRRAISKTAKGSICLWVMMMMGHFSDAQHFYSGNNTWRYRGEDSLLISKDKVKSISKTVCEFFSDKGDTTIKPFEYIEFDKNGNMVRDTVPGSYSRIITFSKGSKVPAIETDLAEGATASIIHFNSAGQIASYIDYGSHTRTTYFYKNDKPDKEIERSLRADSTLLDTVVYAYDSYGRLKVRGIFDLQKDGDEHFDETGYDEYDYADNGLLEEDCSTANGSTYCTNYKRDTLKNGDIRTTAYTGPNGSMDSTLDEREVSVRDKNGRLLKAGNISYFYRPDGSLDKALTIGENGKIQMEQLFIYSDNGLLLEDERKSWYDYPVKRLLEVQYLFKYTFYK